MKKIILLILFLVVSFFLLRNNDKFLNFIASFYFNQKYYLKTYPEVAKLNITAFEHYSKIGWKEGKNPSKNFDNEFYRRMYDAGLYRNLEGLNPLQHYIKCELHFKKCYIHPSQLKKANILQKPKYYIALASIFRDEARFLKEWIEFYKLLGVEHFYLYNNLSKDNYLEILKPYIEEGIVELEDIMVNPKNNVELNEIQTQAYTEVAKKVKDIVEWLIFVDTDEFLFPVKDNNLKTLLNKYDDYATLSVNYRDFGSGKIKKINSNELLIEKLTMAEELGNLSTSPIVKPRYIRYFILPHFAVLKEGYAQITENYEYFYGPFSNKQSINIVRANHYWSRDWDFFNTTKISRAHMNLYFDKDKADKTQQLIDRNKKLSEKYDDSILRFLPALQSAMFN